MTLSPEEMIARKQKIREMWEAGLSSGQIGRALGITRNSAIGHVSRMNLATRTGKIKTFTPRATRPRTAPVKLIPLADEPPSFDLSIEALSDKVCRWSHGDRDFVFCGHAVAPGRIYCPFHCQVSYQKPIPYRPKQ